MTDKTPGEVIAALVLEYEQEERWSAETMAAYSDLEAAGQITEAMLLPCIGELFTFGYLQRALRAFRLANPKSGKKFYMPLKGITAAELQKMEIPPTQWIIKDLLPEGLCILVGAPKSKKSFMALDLALAVARGRDFLGFQANKSKAIYLDLESKKARTKERIGLILGEGKPFPAELIIITGENLGEVALIRNGFEEQLDAFLDDYEGVKLVIIDVLQKIRPPEKGRQNQYDRDYNDLNGLKRLADRRGICILLLHHTHKGENADVFDKMNGSMAMFGAMDVAWVIQAEKRFDDEATLSIEARDFEGGTYRIKWEKKQFYWNMLGTEEEASVREQFLEYDENPITNAIRALVKDAGSWEGSAQDLINSSKFTSHWIQEKAASVGKYVSAHIDDLFRYDGIKAIKGKNDTRFYKFFLSTCPPVRNEQLSMTGMTVWTGGTDKTVVDSNNITDSKTDGQ